MATIAEIAEETGTKAAQIDRRSLTPVALA
jgi:hypothetical protein